MDLLNSVVRRNETVAWRSIDKEALLVNPRDGLIYPLNPVAKRVWELIDGSRTCSELIEIVDREFEGDKSNIQQDILSFIGDLIDKGMAILQD
ncbi:MAG: PqqD family protein [Candidatus Omnitrophica bacterium]|nr:PqqD family protein [Candidatus Omnitrophota bacterium]